MTIDKLQTPITPYGPTHLDFMGVFGTFFAVFFLLILLKIETETFEKQLHMFYSCMHVRGWGLW